MSEELHLDFPNKNSLTETEELVEASRLRIESNDSHSSEDDAGPVVNRKQRVNCLSDSDTDYDKNNTNNIMQYVDDTILSSKSLKDCNKKSNIYPLSESKKNSDQESDPLNSYKKIKNADSWDCDNKSSLNDTDELNGKPAYESIRMKTKKKKLKDKFKTLLSSQQKVTTQKVDSASDYSENSDNEVSCLKIKQKKMKKSAYSMKSICDPDTSEEEASTSKKPKLLKLKKVKPTSTKPIRMSSKQAIKNMHKIKSESNRMLREKEVLLPYHRPKALSLKDIMNRRKLPVSTDGKVLSVKMNSEQLKQYALLLEERQKEVIELCKSDTEEELDDTQANGKDVHVDLPMESEKRLSNDIMNSTTEQKESACTVEEDNTNSGNEACKSQINLQNSKMIEDSLVEEQNSESLNNLYSINTENKRDDSNIKENVVHEEVPVTELNENSASVMERESQLLYLQYDTENENILKENNCKHIESNIVSIEKDKIEESDKENHNSKKYDFLDNDFNYDELHKIMAEAEIYDQRLNNKEVNQIPANVENKTVKMNFNPKLTGAPGTVIDLDSETPKQMSGVELLKERFTYFAKLKSMEDMEKDREKKFKPFTQHLKLKLELEQQIAEQRLIEWEKRLEMEKQSKSEMDDDIEKIEAKLNDAEETMEDEKVDSESTESEEEPIEDDVLLEDKPQKRNALVDDEADESECDEDNPGDNKDSDVDMENYEDEGVDGDQEDSNDDTSDSSSDSDEEEQSKPKKGRILKAFEDSDDEDLKAPDMEQLITEIIDEKVETTTYKDNDMVQDTQDEELQLAQRNKSSEDMFSTQESITSNLVLTVLNKDVGDGSSAELGSQTFSIINSVNATHKEALLLSDELPTGTQSQDDVNFEAIAGMCSGSFTQNLVATQNLPPLLTQTEDIGAGITALCSDQIYDNPVVTQANDANPNNSEIAKSQEIGDDIAALCTGKFYDNPFVSQSEENDGESETINDKNKEASSKNGEDVILKSIIDELDGPDFDKPKNKYFPCDMKSKVNVEKKKLVIESDEEIDESTPHKKKKIKKRTAAQRALQISDDEEEEGEELVEDDEFESEIENEEEKIVEYDSEENEIEVQQKTSKKNRVGGFFENEAELTSEDEWVGSGDEDERDLDRMEREEGDDDTFHQGKLRRELGQIHMREVLDQDKREVRLLQELLFEDGDLGDGHRQRKFRWKNADGDEETGTNPDEFVDTQEAEYESEEQWRKQRHEREMFLRKMQEKEDEEIVNTSINRTAIIKANLCSRSMSMLLSDPNTNSVGAAKADSGALEKKSSKDIPSPKKPFAIFQQNYHNSLLTRGRGALARLAALATPLAIDNDDPPKLLATSNSRNFVFAALSQAKQPKVTKRKAEDKVVSTPRLIKKMKIEDTSKSYKSSLFDYLNN